MKKCAKEIEGYIFVGNTPTEGDLSELKNVKYRIGEIALDIHGKELDEKYMVSLYIEEGKSYDEYNRIMMAQFRKIRNS